ncbi:MAG: hypothetical protein RJA70_1181 [Pseudomonadota bacterium]
MGTVYYGLAGEGRGHATRAHTIIEHLKTQHQVEVLTFGQAFDMLKPLYSTGHVRVRDIGGMYLEYGRDGRMSPTRTLLKGVPFAARMNIKAQRLAAELSARRASLVIADFEPVSERAARFAGIPVVSIDHQRYLQTCVLGDLPLTQRLKISAMNTVIKAIYGTADHLIVSGFHLPPLKPEFRHAQAVGVLLRDEVLNAHPTSGEHLVVYLRRSCPNSVLDVLSRAQCPVHIYGLGERAPHGALQFLQVSPSEFIRDLASCKALVSTAGNQLIGEALYLLKPVLAFPEPGNFEQEINGHLLNEHGGGLALSDEALTSERLAQFLRGLDTYRGRIRPEKIAGNRAVFERLDALLGG